MPAVTEVAASIVAIAAERALAVVCFQFSAVELPMRFWLQITSMRSISMVYDLKRDEGTVLRAVMSNVRQGMSI